MGVRVALVDGEFVGDLAGLPDETVRRSLSRTNRCMSAVSR